jgi:hypothetical protein
MRISHDIRDESERRAGMEKKSREFLQEGARLYVESEKPAP